MLNIPNQIVAFAGGDNLGIYKHFTDLYNHNLAVNHNVPGVEYDKYGVDSEGNRVEISYAEKEAALNIELKREIMRHAGINDISAFPIETWATHPTLKWAMFATINSMIDAVLPDAVIRHIGLYSEVRNIGWGDNASFDFSPRDIFAVSKVGRSKRTTELHSQKKGQTIINPELRELSVFVNLMKVLAGKESLAELVFKMVKSFETELSYDVYSTMATAMAALPTTASTGLRVSGWSESEFVRLSQTVSAYNGGARAIAIGTQLALANVIPQNNVNYRYDLSSDYVKVGFLPNFKGTDLMVLPQVPNWATPFGLKLSDEKIWIISPSSDKLVKVVLEGNTLSHTDDQFANANLTQASSIMKSWGTGIATNAIAAEIDMS